MCTVIFAYVYLGLYALINNAGVCVCGEFDWQTWDQINRQVEVREYRLADLVPDQPSGGGKRVQIGRSGTRSTVRWR